MIAGGVIGLAFGGITYGKRRDTVQMGPLSASVTQREALPITPITGGVAVIAGIALVVADSRRQT